MIKAVRESVDSQQQQQQQQHGMFNLLKATLALVSRDCHSSAAFIRGPRTLP